MSCTCRSSSLLLGVLALTACGPQPGEPGDYIPRRDRALALYESGQDPQAALEALREVQRLRPDAYAVNLRLGHLLAEARQRGEALRHFELALARRPEDTETLLNIARLRWQLGDVTGVRATLPGLLADPGQRSEGIHLQALLLDEQGRPGDALALLEQHRDLDPVLAYRAFSLHGRLLLEAGRIPEARERFARALSGRLDYKESLKGLADSSRRMGEREDAEHYDELLALFVDLTDNQVLSRRSEWRRPRLVRLTQIHPDWPDAFLELARLQRDSGEDEAACATIAALLAHHAGRLDARESAELRAGFCPEDDG